ncbi:patatin-like phospholipase family protein [Geopsychrobacter electrodiphilus]|uniref:patatin-like phospholipase family protein n=1 Tax=Geopsychrobacter electrodiphilus TaxID=225196 RepID=UPI00037C9D14|nr:patatin-like phospholipase family protein [Geopsychrobacter electrodiphilus]
MGWFDKKRLGLALGGGAARGMAHIGVLQAFEEAKIPVDVVTGTSMGAIIGGMYASRPEVEPLRKKFEAYLKSEVFRRSRLDFAVERDQLNGGGLFFRFSQLARQKIFYMLSLTTLAFVSQETTNQSFAFLLPDIDIEMMSLPFATSALDLHSCREVVLQRGSLRQAVAATCALPGVLPPVELNSQLLVDGGWINAVPIIPARDLGADLVIAVDVGCHLGELDTVSSGLEVVFRADAAARNALSELQLTQADLVIRPDVGDNHWADFSRTDWLIRKGYEAANEQMPQIRALVNSRSFIESLGWS